MPVKNICEDGASSTSGYPPENAGSSPAPRSTPELYLEVCSANDPRYLDIRSRHYVPQKGTHGQQVHFLVWYKERYVGIISGASAVYATVLRDKFFGITKENREKCLNGIIDNVVFRLDHDRLAIDDMLSPNHLASKIVLLWEKSVAWVWGILYGVKVFGFETFVVTEGFMKERVLDGEFDKYGRPRRQVDLIEDATGKNIRKGGTYLAVGWSFLGRTSGNTKGHDRVGLTGGKTGKGVFLRKKVPPKNVLCKWIPGLSAPIESDYKSSWKAGTPKGTPEEKALAKWRAEARRKLLGTKFHSEGRVLVYENIEQATSGRVEWNASGASAKTRVGKVRQSNRAPLEREDLRKTKAI